MHAAMMYRPLILTALLIDVSALNVPNCKASRVASSRRLQLRLASPVMSDVGAGTPTAIETTVNQQIFVDSTSFDNNVKGRKLLQFGVSNDAYRAALDDDNVDIAIQQSAFLLSEGTSDSSVTPEQAGKWFFVAYVAVSIVAGFKELGGRFQKWLANRER